MRLLLASLLLTSACATDDDVWWPPSSAGGKADGVQILKGSDIPSQFVTAGKKYLTGRQLDSLEEVKALADDTMHEVAMRADGIVANHPADGRLDAGELVKFESGELAASLFPEEKAALPKLWKLLEAPGGSAVSMANVAPNVTPTEHRVEPGGLTAPTSVMISSLKTEWQTLAKRVELLANADGNASTIQLADVEHALANPGPFTPAEIEKLALIKNEILSRATSTEIAEVIVPRPGPTMTHGMIGSIAIDFTADVTIREERGVSRWDGTSDTPSFSGSLFFDWTANGTLHTNQADSLVLLQLDTGKETVVSGSEIELPEVAGSVVVERYVAGDRQETHLVAFPAFSPGSHMGDHDWGEYLDYDFVLADHTHLVKNVTATKYESQYYSNNYGQTLKHWFATFRWEREAKPSPGANYEEDVLGEVETPSVALPPGRYEQPIGNGQTAYLDIYRPGVFFIRIGNESGRLERHGADEFGWNSDNDAWAMFESWSSELHVSIGDVDHDFTLSVAQRIK